MTRTGVAREGFGTAPDGEAVERVVLSGRDGLRLAVIGFGAAIQSLHVPDGSGALADIVLGHDDLDGYRRDRSFFGATVGRYANRIADGRFRLDGREFRVEPNDRGHALHGGPSGFDRRTWRLEAVEEGDEPAATFARRSPAGEEGFPGTLDVTARFRLAPGRVEIELAATTDAPTVVNLTNHSFFNLSGVAVPASILGHRIAIDADAFLPVDGAGIPTGERRPVDGTPFDFREAQAIGERIRGADPQLVGGLGYDHNFCLAPAEPGQVRRAARVEDPRSGRAMEVWTDQPGLQFYSGNQLKGAVVGKNGQAYRQSDAFCLEPQLWPDSPNRADFPSARLEPGDTYRHTIHYRFGQAATTRPAP